MNTGSFGRSLALMLLLLPAASQAQLVDNSPVKFAFYSSAWGENAVSGLRVVSENQQDFSIQLKSITFPSSDPGMESLTVDLDLNVPPRGFAEKVLPYVDLLAHDSCVADTMAEDWKLVEISNYTLNPSVRSLIIEDTNAFRIYQCVRKVSTTWEGGPQNESHQFEEWVLYHFERRIDR